MQIATAGRLPALHLRRHPPRPGIPGLTNTSNSLGYDRNGNLTHYKGWVYTYDAQNRLRSASNGATSATFYYDGKNRQIARSINRGQSGAGGVIRFSVWDGWELMEEWGSDRAVAYLQGATGVIKSWTPSSVTYYYQDKLGSTTHIANASGALLESYRYDLYGTPSYFNSTSQPLNSSTYNVVDLYAGERWIGELGLYDLRNRFLSSELGRFLQADPIGFKGDASNLYRYCHNDPENFADPMGLVDTSATKLYSRLTSWNGGDWIKGSDGLSALDWNDRNSIRPQAGMDAGGGGGDSSSDKMRFVPTKLQKDKKTAIPTDRDHSGGYYEYQFKDSSDNRKGGVGYTVQEKLSLVPGVPNNTEVKKKDEKPRELQTNGIYRDYVGLWFRPTSESNGLTSVVYQTFDVKYNGRPVEVSTRLVHDVRVINGEVVHKVWIDRP